MENNAVIKGSLLDILNVLDARTIVTVFAKSYDGKGYPKAESRVMDILTDKEFMKVYGSYDVIGITVGIYTHILIQKGE